MYKRQLNDILDSYEKTLRLINQVFTINEKSIFDGYRWIEIWYFIPYQYL